MRTNTVWKNCLPSGT